ncbi:MAG: polysaccharide deacetylase family protein [Thermodesulfobacteriota bacterium]|jgi:peptidoglycan/xylan/chitin deacetylase (PgdA/CDA1 family)
MATPNPGIINALCFDVDDLAYGLNVVKGTHLPNQYLVKQEAYALLESLERLDLQATMFIPGYVALRFPDLVKEIARSGHEIGSHGFNHIVTQRLHRDGFHEDASLSKKILEDILSKEVFIFKAPDWSISADTLWAYDELISLGYRVDHTAQPSLLKSLGRRSDDMTPFTYKEALTVIPVTSCRLLGQVFPFNGGLFCAYVPISRQIAYFRRINQKGIPFNYYCHPYEFSPWGADRQTWKYGSFRAALYGIHFGKYRDYITQLARAFQLAPLTTAYRRFISCLDTAPNSTYKVLE